jgi:hypothetical protein
VVVVDKYYELLKWFQYYNYYYYLIYLKNYYYYYNIDFALYLYLNNYAVVVDNYHNRLLEYDLMMLLKKKNVLEIKILETYGIINYLYFPVDNTLVVDLKKNKISTLYYCFKNLETLE